MIFVFYLFDNYFFSNRQRLLLGYRTFKALFRDCRDRSLSAAYFMRHLRKDVEHTSHYISDSELPELIGKMECHSFVLVTSPFSFNSQFCAFVPSQLRNKPNDVVRLFNILCGNASNSHQIVDGYLILLAAPHDLVAQWKSTMMTVTLPVQTLIALSQIRVDGIFLIAQNLPQQQMKFARRMGPMVRIHCEQTSPHQDVADCLRQMKTECLNLVSRIIQMIDEMIENISTMIQDLTDTRPEDLFDIKTLFAKILQQCFFYGFDYVKSIVHLMSGPLKHQHSEAAVNLAIKWMDFVVKNCPRGRGTKPSWANQGLDFITWATEVSVTQALDPQLFSSFKDRVQMCIIHIVGGSVIRCLPEGRIVINRSASTRSLSSVGLPMNLSSHDSLSAATGSAVAAALGLGQAQLRVATRPPSVAQLRISEKPIDRVRKALHQVDQKREARLRNSRFIGHVTNVRPVDEDLHQYIKKVNFRWQKGMKIGAGQWKVYTAINLDTGQLMAMKKITLQNNASQQLRMIADEIQNLENIKHPSLVRYYGVELHTNELLIFMEYCPGGSLAEACRGGLDESTVRRYTRRILVALSVLHDHGIVHRDIKAANIFLTAEGSVKVGDFGCAVKLQQTVTTAGDMPNMAGTISYMSPEVIRNEQGRIGRPADIWALGCVVIEMIDGQPPWHELENQYQVMYKVCCISPFSLCKFVFKFESSYLDWNGCQAKYSSAVVSGRARLSAEMFHGTPTATSLSSATIGTSIR